MITKQKWKYFQKWFCTCDALHMQTYLRVCLRMRIQSHTSHGTVWWSGKYNLLQQLELASELESGLQDITIGAGSGSLISMLEKLNWFYLTSLVTLVLLMWKWLGLFLRKKYLLRYWLSLLNWIQALTLFLLLKLPPRQLELWFTL